MINNVNGYKWRAGVILAGTWVIFWSAKGLWNMRSYQAYSALFGYLPKNILVIRYFFSAASRILMLTAGIGILSFRDIFRKLLILMSALTVAACYWKHPIESFRNAFRILLEKKMIPVYPAGAYEKLAWIMLVMNCAADILIAATLIYFFTRPKTKELFR